MLHLQLGFLADHGLVQHHVIEHAAQRVVGVVVGGRVLDRFADRDPEAARRIGRGGQDAAAGLVCSLGLGKTSAPQVCIIMRR